jgi:hypothetical protein
MGNVVSNLRKSAIVAGGALAILGAVAMQADASTHDFNVINDRTVVQGSTSVFLFHVVDSDHLASYAYVKSGPGGVQARAKCARRNGGTNWYQSTIYVKAGGGNSHYDCDNNGTYNYSIKGLGADIH